MKLHWRERRGVWKIEVEAIGSLVGVRGVDKNELLIDEIVAWMCNLAVTFDFPRFLTNIVRLILVFLINNSSKSSRSYLLVIHSNWLIVIRCNWLICWVWMYDWSLISFPPQSFQIGAPIWSVEKYRKILFFYREGVKHFYVEESHN